MQSLILLFLDQLPILDYFHLILVHTMNILALFTFYTIYLNHCLITEGFQINCTYLSNHVSVYCITWSYKSKYRILCQLLQSHVCYQTVSWPYHSISFPPYNIWIAILMSIKELVKIITKNISGAWTQSCCLV